VTKGKNFGFRVQDDGDMVRMLVSDKEREKGVSVTKHHVILSDKTGSLARVGKTEHSNWVIFFVSLWISMRVSVVRSIFIGLDRWCAAVLVVLVYFIVSIRGCFAC
jgi:hypothetical protein